MYFNNHYGLLIDNLAGDNLEFTVRFSELDNLEPVCTENFYQKYVFIEKVEIGDSMFCML